MADDFEVAALLKAFYCRWGKENLCKRKAFEWGGDVSCVPAKVNKGNGKPKENLFAAKVFGMQIL